MAEADSDENVDVAMELAEIFKKPCVDCEHPTCNICEGCMVPDYLPGEEGKPGKTRPLCNKCEDKMGECHFCRKRACGAPPLAKPKASPTAVGAAGAAMACAAGDAVGSTVECAVSETIGSGVGSAVGGALCDRKDGQRCREAHSSTVVS